MMLDWPRGIARLLGLAILGASAVACSSYTLAAPERPVLHPFAPIPASAGMARVCAVRTNKYFAHAVTFPTWDNDVLVGATKGGTYFCYGAEPGNHTIRIKADGDTRVALVAEAGKSYYLLEDAPFNLVHLTPKGRWLDDAEAREAIAEARYEIVVGAPKSEVLPPPPIVVKAIPTGSPTAAAER